MNVIECMYVIKNMKKKRYFTLDSAFDKNSPVSYEKPTSCMVYRHSTRRNGTDYSQRRKTKEEKILKDVQIQTGPPLVYFTLATAVRNCSMIFMPTMLL
jgi:hypothetical protein